MKSNWVSWAIVFSAGIGIGAMLSGTVLEDASAEGSVSDPSAVMFTVSISEVKRTLLLGENFNGRFERSFEMSDGSIRSVVLTPMEKDGRLIVEFDDTGFVTYMGPNGWTVNKDLRVDLRDYDQVGRRPSE